MKIGMCQTWMYPTIEENLENIVKNIRECEKNRAELVIFPECGLTGFHRKLPSQVNYETLAKSFKKILNCSKESNVSVIIGSPFIDTVNKNEIFNSALFFSPELEKPKITSKVGLTEVEHLYFTEGLTRKVFHIGKFNIGVIFCIEMDDKEDILNDFKDAKLDSIAWISYINWNGKVNSQNKIDYQNSLDISLALNVPIINVNWANSINDNLMKGMGGSRFINNGKLIFELEEDSEQLKIIETNDYCWIRESL